MNLLRSAKTTGCTEFGVATLLKLVYLEICKKHGMQRNERITKTYFTN